jgi:hypothetical protein
MISLRWIALVSTWAAVWYFFGGIDSERVFGFDLDDNPLISERRAVRYSIYALLLLLGVWWSQIKRR